MNKTFDIKEVDALSPIGEPGSVQMCIRLQNYRIPPIGRDAEGELIYPVRTPEDIEMEEHYRCYRISMVKHTKPASERKDVSDGAVQKAVSSTFFDSRNKEDEVSEMQAALGLALMCIIGSEP